MKIYDCFTFYNEFELLELRLKLLSPYVDYFVLSEADVTLRGERKPLFFKENRERFSEYKDKIIALTLREEERQTKPLDWYIEKKQRNYLVNGLKNSADEDLVIVSDVDEIPNPSILKGLKDNELDIENNIYKIHRIIRKRKDKIKAYRDLISLFYLRQKKASVKEYLQQAPFACGQRHFYYFMNNLHPDLWCGSVFCLKRNFKSAQDLRDLRRKLPIFLPGGWHFAYMGGIDRILKKVNSTVDENGGSENNRKYTKEHVIECIKNGTLIYDYQAKEKAMFKLISSNEIGINQKIIDAFSLKYPQFFLEGEK